MKAFGGRAALPGLAHLRCGRHRAGASRRVSWPRSSRASRGRGGRFPQEGGESCGSWVWSTPFLLPRPFAQLAPLASSSPHPCFVGMDVYTGIHPGASAEPSGTFFHVLLPACAKMKPGCGRSAYAWKSTLIEKLRPAWARRPAGEGFGGLPLTGGGASGEPDCSRFRF